MARSPLARQLRAAQFALATLSVGFAPATAQTPGGISVAVTLPDGSPAANATIFINSQRVAAGPDGQWHGPLPGAGRMGTRR
jgi:hypothetical protein